MLILIRIKIKEISFTKPSNFNYSAASHWTISCASPVIDSSITAPYPLYCTATATLSVTAPCHLLHYTATLCYCCTLPVVARIATLSGTAPYQLLHCTATLSVTAHYPLVHCTATLSVTAHHPLLHCTDTLSVTAHYPLLHCHTLCFCTLPVTALH